MVQSRKPLGAKFRTTEPWRASDLVQYFGHFHIAVTGTRILLMLEVVDRKRHRPGRVDDQRVHEGIGGQRKHSGIGWTMASGGTNAHKHCENHDRPRQHRLSVVAWTGLPRPLSLIHISEPTRRTPISYAVF